MSEQAIRARNLRKIWAAGGSAHDRNVRIALIGLPLLGGALAGLMIIAPITVKDDVSFMLAKNTVAVSKERMRLTQATYRGEDGDGRPFRIEAGSAVQASSRDPIVMLQALSARIGLAAGPATVQAMRGSYDMDTENVKIFGPMVFKTSDGFQMVAQNVSLDLKSRRITSAGRVDGRIPLGHFAAEHLDADITTRTVTLVGHAHLHIDQRSGRGWKL